MSSEVWLPLKGHETAYEISSLSNLRSLSRYTQAGKMGHYRWHTGSPIKYALDRRGYPRVKLNDGKSYRIHRLVALTFLEAPNGDKVTVNHKDGNKLNNSVENLEWASYLDNFKHAVTNNLITYPFGKEAKRFERSVEVYKDGKLILVLNGNKHMEENGFDFRLVSACLKGKRKTHRGCTFKPVYKGDYENV